VAVRAIRGAITVTEDSAIAIQSAVNELLGTIEAKNTEVLELTEIVSVIFSVTRDLKQAFPAATARKRQGWQEVPLLDVQQMHVEQGLSRCIRCLIQFNTSSPHPKVHHIYLREAKGLRPDWS
jgi:chorismate mutase